MRIIYTILSLVFAMSVSAQDNSQYEKKEFIAGQDTLRYRILYPLKFDIGKKYPLVVFLHGSGERGSDNEVQLVHGGKLFTDPANRQKYPAIVIFPQCPQADFWSRMKRAEQKNDSLGGFAFPSEEPVGTSLGLVGKLLDSLNKVKTVNNKKIYLGGLSMGGMGTFELLWRKPGFFAAAIPICGGGDPAKVNTYARNFPVWIFHGGSDPVVPVGNSHLMANSLKVAGAKVKYTEYPGVGHNSWDNAFAEPGLLDWLFAQKK